MSGENTSNEDGFLKDTYEKKSTAQTGFHKANDKGRCAICGKRSGDMRGRVCGDCAFKGKK